MNTLPTAFAAVLATALVLCVPMSPARAQTPPPSESEARLAEARRDLADAARRVAELSQQMAGDAQRIAIERIQLAGGDRPRLGLVLGTGPEGGVSVGGVTPDGPAAQAGLRSGDVVEAINGEALDDTDAIARVRHARELLSELSDGQRVSLRVRRDGQPREFDVEARTMPGTLWAGGLDAVLDADVRERLQSLTSLRELGLVPPQLDIDIGAILPFAGCGEDAQGECRAPRLLEALRWRALNLATVEPRLGRYFGVDHGVLVVASDERLQGLEPGDVILSIDATPVHSPAEAMRELSRHPAGTQIPMRVQRDGAERDITVTAPAAEAVGRVLLRRLGAAG